MTTYVDLRINTKPCNFFLISHGSTEIVIAEN